MTGAVYPLSPPPRAPGPLEGIGVIVTRPQRQAAVFAAKIGAVGGVPIVWPAIVILPPADATSLAHAHATLATTAERAFSRALGGSCQTPLAAYAEWEEGRLWLRALLASRDGRDVMRGERESAVAEVDDARALGSALADDFLRRGAHRLAAAAA